MDTLTIAIEDRSMTSVIRKMLGAMRGVAIITPEQDAQLAAPAHREYHISPRIKAEACLAPVLQQRRQLPAVCRPMQQAGRIVGRRHLATHLAPRLVGRGLEVDAAGMQVGRHGPDGSIFFHGNVIF